MTVAVGRKDVMTFGKYKGETVDFVFSFNPSYLFWAHQNVSWFTLKPSLLRKVLDQILEDKIKIYTGYGTPFDPDWDWEEEIY